MAIQIRAMHSQDYPAASNLWKSLPGMGLSSADRQDAILTFLEKNPKTCFVAEDEGVLIGTILGGNDGRRGFLYHLAVQRDYQKQGIGRKLTQTCLQALRENGIEKCHIFVIADNREGFNFWEKEGWILRDDILLLSKDLI
jgi:ribosomal protein S18 acetylase RimI-like enzyme